ncbi:MAG TPA: beta-ketoacyl-ACP reductase [Kosmotogaceae bacterium]|nr:MAG: 3-oxoacyl-(Acyl-carrier-protein) reductase [Thermotogales bacterium 46_20]HAA86132.1 beta-ketoacyl-ACP reductase [Kosmotogaceae bacterium]
MSRIALVTGGTGGIGKAIVNTLVEDGMKVAFTYNSNTEESEEIEGRFGRDQTKAFKCDISNTDEIKKLVDDVSSAFGTVEVLVNNAGISKNRLVLRTSMEDWKRVMEVNLDGAFALTQAILPGMIKKRWGRIIFVSSVAGLMGNVGQASYASSKAALVGLAKTVAREVSSRSITCNVVAPGLINTTMTREIREEYMKRLMEIIPLKRLGTPEEVASLVSYLSGDTASYITGQVLVVDGGLSM